MRTTAVALTTLTYTRGVAFWGEGAGEGAFAAVLDLAKGFHSCGQAEALNSSPTASATTATITPAPAPTPSATNKTESAKQTQKIGY
jgi:hypothetical protein